MRSECTRSSKISAHRHFRLFATSVKINKINRSDETGNKHAHSRVSWRSEFTRTIKSDQIRSRKRYLTFEEPNTGQVRVRATSQTKCPTRLRQVTRQVTHLSVTSQKVDTRPTATDSRKKKNTSTPFSNVIYYELLNENQTVSKRSCRFKLCQKGFVSLQRRSTATWVERNSKKLENLIGSLCLSFAFLPVKG